jgi:hypothetical protein
MTAVAYPISAFNPVPVCWRGVEQVHRSAGTSPWARSDEPISSAAASTNEPAAFDPRSASWFQPVVDRLNYLLRLEAGWGGPGTVHVDQRAVERALQALALIALPKTRPPSISPGPDGSLQLAWYTRDLELEIDVPLSGEITASLYEHDSGEESELALTSPRLPSVIERLRAN